MSNPTSPLTDEQQQSRLHFRMELAFLVAFVGIVVLWTFKPPDLPGDIAGAVVGGFIGWIGGNSTKPKQGQ